MATSKRKSEMVWGASYSGAMYLHHGLPMGPAVCGGMIVKPTITEGRKCAACLRYEKTGTLD